MKKYSITGYWTKFTFYFLVATMMKNSDTVKQITTFSGINCYFMILLPPFYIFFVQLDTPHDSRLVLADEIWFTKSKYKHYKNLPIKIY